MANEIEVKLEADGAAARRLLDARWLQRLEAAPAKRERLLSVYYDTRKRALRREGISLRVRGSGGKRVQTVKAGARGSCGPFCREEWEHELPGRQPDLDGAQKTALDRFKLKKLRRKLRPVFTTDIERIAVPLRWDGSEIELAIDRGEVRTRQKRAAINEIEIELKNGDPAQLVKLAKRIADATAASFGPLGKADRGHALGTADGAAAVKGRDIALDPTMTAGDAFKMIGLACVHHFAANRAAIEAGDTEGVHQMRVGLRRLRAALSLFKDFLHDREGARIKTELKWLLDELGPARDLDVLISESVEPLQQERVDGEALAALKSDLSRRRRDGMARAKAAVDSERYRTLALDTALWIACGGWSRNRAPLVAGRRDRKLADFAAEELARRDRKIVKRVKKLDQLDPRCRHKLRIAVKKLRYADEFFAALYARGTAHRRWKRHDATLKTLQSALGKLTDMQTHKQMAGAFVRSRRHAPKGPQKAFAMGLISGKDHARARALIAAACDAGKKLSGLKPFWH